MASANPTFAEWGALLAECCEWLEIVRLAAQSNSPNLLAQEDTITQALEGSTTSLATTLSELTALRSNVSRALDGAAFLTAVMFIVRHRIGSEAEDITTFVADLNRYMADNSESINSRDITFGTFSAGGSNVGNAVIRRLTVDKWGNDIESILTATGFSARVIEDQNTGTNAGQETWEIRGYPAGDDNLDAQDTGRGTGIIQRINNKSADDSDLLNASFADYSGPAATPTAITSWTVVNSISNCEIDTTNYYVASTIEGDTPAALNLTATEEVNQALSVKGTTLDAENPRYLQVAWNRQVGSASGTLAIHMGATSTSVSVSAQTGWQLLFIPLDENCYPLNFTEDAMDIRIVWTRSGGEILIDDVRFVAIDDVVDTIPTIALGGSTHSLLEDTGTVSDTVATNAVIQNTISRNLGVHLQSAGSGGETIADA